LKFTIISDTHGKHSKLTLPAGDVLIHAGDISSRGRPAEVLDFLNWFAVQHFEHKIFIAGNHDFYFENTPADAIQQIIPAGVTYLNDSGTTVNGIRIWGSPVTPWFYDWAFNRRRGPDIQQHWELIPGDTQILITHGPVFGILDRTTAGLNAGCDDLLIKVNELKPLVHICGHIHEASGQVSRDGITFINASVLNERYELVNDPIVFES
jgi:Icc-related predicted phosphoesterase